MDKWTDGFYNHRHYDSESKQSSPPVNGSLVELLRGSDDARAQSRVLHGDERRNGRRDHSTPPADPPQAQGKRSRYLRESDRRDIIRRIDSGEKQAALAKEFGVTRAAICHTYKKRNEILARSGRLDRQASDARDEVDTHQTPQHQLPATRRAPHVSEVRSTPLALLITTLRRKETKHRQFRAAADRAFRLLLEEALALVPLRSVDVVTPHDVICRGLVVDRPTCAMVMSERGYPLLETFRVIQPDSPTGFLTFSAGDPHVLHLPRRSVLSKLCFPSDLIHRNTFLLDAVCVDWREVVAAIQLLVDLDALEQSIYLVALVISATAVEEIHRRFPRVSVTAAAIDAGSLEGECCSLGGFQERYFNTTTIYQDEFGSLVDL